jgi:hypothetical protein
MKRKCRNCVCSVLEMSFRFQNVQFVYSVLIMLQIWPNYDLPSSKHVATLVLYKTVAFCGHLLGFLWPFACFFLAILVPCQLSRS